MDDRNFDELMQEALHLDYEHQRQLRDALDQQLTGPNQAQIEEAVRRIEAYDRGEEKSSDLREAMARVRKRAGS